MDSVETPIVDSQQISPTPAVVDVNDPLWLHHSERSNYVLSTQLLNDNNYYKWRRASEISLKAKSKMAFVSGAVSKSALDSPIFPQWERCNSMVTSWFFHSVEKDIAESLLYFDTTAEIWADLQVRFGSPNSSRIFQVQKELFTVSQGNISVSSYYTNFRRLWDEFVVLVELPRCASCDTVGAVPPLLFTLQVVQFLVGLNDVYASVRTNILLRKPMPSLGEVYNLVLQDEQHRGLHSISPLSSNSTVLNASHKPSYGSGRGHVSGPSSGGRGSSSRGGARGADRRSHFFCDHCKMPGHTMDRSYKLHGYPNQRADSRSQSGNSFSGNADFSGTGGSVVQGSPQPGENTSEEAPSLTKDQYNQLIALLSRSDIGNSAPKTGLMTDSKPLLHPDFITMPDGSRSEITHMGVVKLTDQITLSHVLLVPRFTFNLLSVPQDVHFYEEVFPLASTPLLPSSLPLPPLLMEDGSDDPYVVPAPPNSAVMDVAISPPAASAEPEQVPDAPRRTSRHIQPPGYLRDYVCNSAIPVDQFPLIGELPFNIQITRSVK
ncbi:hypothetical protein V2J09_017656 [Rumex salicifolius]